MSHRSTRHFLNGHRYRDSVAVMAHALLLRCERLADVIETIDMVLRDGSLSYAERAEMEAERHRLIAHRADVLARLDEYTEVV